MFIITVVVRAQAGTVLFLQGFFNGGGQLFILVYAQQYVNLRQFLHQVSGIALAEAAGNDQHPAPAGLLVFGHFQDRIDRFLFRRINEPAGIYQQDIRFRRIAGDPVAFFLQQAEGCFRVHPVLVAAQRDRPDSIGHETPSLPL